MDLSEFLQLLKNYGDMGLFVGYLVWQQLRTDRIAKENRVEDNEREDKRVDADKGLAVSLALLTRTIEGGR